jgi:ABC-type sugar transport system substrate-binding protein
MAQAAAADPLIADFVTRARDFWPAWNAEMKAAGADLMARGCGW